MPVSGMAGLRASAADSQVIRTCHVRLDHSRPQPAAHDTPRAPPTAQSEYSAGVRGVCLGAEISMSRSAFDDVPCGLYPVPQARRGMTLRQLTAISEALLDTGWLHSLCAAFNNENEEAIKAGRKFAMCPNLYAIDSALVQPTTNPDSTARNDIPDAVLETANIPPSRVLFLS